jgi:hypothetical protein
MSAPPIVQEVVARQRERRMQVRGLLLLAVVVLVFSIWRAGAHRVFTQGWWRLW